MPIIISENFFFFLRNSRSKRGNNSNKILDGVVFFVNRLGSTLSTSVLSFKLIALIVIEKF